MLHINELLLNVLITFLSSVILEIGSIDCKSRLWL